MVVLSVAITSKSGKVILARQFIDMPRGRIEGLISAFGKLALADVEREGDRQDTSIETESVRYLWQPIEEFIVVLVTSKGSNIIEDLDTLHTFAKIVSSYCPRISEKDVVENFVDLCIAFDQAITPNGHKERATVGQIRSFVEMDSHDEKMAELDQEAKKRATRDIAASKVRFFLHSPSTPPFSLSLTLLFAATRKKKQAKELKEARERAAKAARAAGIVPGPTASSMVTAQASSPSKATTQPYVEARTPARSPAPASSSSSSAASGVTGMVLGKKSAQKTLVEQIAKEEQGRQALLPGTAAETTARAAPAATTAPAAAAPAPAPEVKHEAVHVTIEERVTVKALNDGTVESMEVKGELSILASTPEAARAVIVIRGHKASFQWKAHPQIEKTRWANESALTARDPARPFPVGAVITVLRWHLAGTAGTVSESDLPLSVTCWPSPSTEGMVVSMEYELRGGESAQLDDVAIRIPVPGAEAPEVGQVDGDYGLSDGALVWRVGRVTGAKPTGSIEFSSREAAGASAFFPIDVTFSSPRCFSGLEIASVTVDGKPIACSKQVSIQVGKYTIGTAGQ